MAPSTRANRALTTGRADPPALDGPAILKRIESIKKQFSAGLDELNRLEEVVANGQTSTRALVIEFRNAWEAKYQGDTYVPNDAGDNSVMRKLLKTLSADEIRRRMRTFFDCSDQWFVQNRHPLTLFGSKVNLFGGGPKPAGADTQAAVQMQDELAEMGFGTPRRQP